MRGIVGCEFSQVITKAFRDRGHEFYSCDLKPTEGNPDWHFQEDLFKVLERERFDLGIFHPECKYLCFSGERWMKERPERVELRMLAFEFFKKCMNANIPKICTENSHSIFLNTKYRKPDQTVHPYHFGDPFKKSTCLWLKGLPPLVPTNILPIGKRYPAAWREGPSANRSNIRAKTYPGIAQAMAEQWGIFT